MNINRMKTRNMLLTICSLGLAVVLLLISGCEKSGAVTKADMTTLPTTTNEQNKDTPVKVISSVLTTPNTIEVIFDSKFTSFNPSDISIAKATGTWNNLDSLLNATIPAKSVSTRENGKHQTVAVIEIDQKLNADATFSREDVIVPGKVPYLTTAYYSGNRQKDIQQADSLLTWQTTSNGWFKNMAKDYEQPWDGKASRSEWRTKSGGELGTIDNDGTTNELLFLAVMYKETGDSRYKDSVLKAIDFLLKMQVKSGGWPQVYPARGNYSDYVTFNDNAMMRVMNVLTLVTKRKYPFNSDLVSDSLRGSIQSSLDRGLDYILKSQISVNGKLTAWCAQHDPVTYEPRMARAYEFPSVSGSESVGIVQYLMALPNQSDDVKKAIQGALSWFEEVRVKGTKFIPADPKNVYFVQDPNSSIWYRFYEIGTNAPIFSGRDSVIKHNLLDIEKERRDGYAWVGTWPAKLLQVAATTGYFENHVYVKVNGTDSKDSAGRTLRLGQLSLITGGSPK